MGPDAMILVFWMLSFKPIFHSPILIICLPIYKYGIYLYLMDF